MDIGGRAWMFNKLETLAVEVVGGKPGAGAWKHADMIFW